MNICVIGGSGFVGSRLVEILKDKYNVKIFDKRMSPFYPEITTIIDIRDKVLLTEKLKGFDLIVHLAAEHRDDVYPISLYYDVNVTGTQNILNAMIENNIKNIIFTSSVAVYGINKLNPDEDSPKDPFNHYGKSKLLAEEVLIDWYKNSPKSNSLTIIRPTVIFGERNRGNVYNLLKQISSKRFIMIGNGNNKKSMAYVGNVVAFIEQIISKNRSNFQIFNYVDKPDLSIKELVQHVQLCLNKKVPSIKLPYWIGYLGGLYFDFLAKITRKKFSISAIRVKKFCATTQFDATALIDSGFIPPFKIKEALSRTIKFEFIDKLEKEEITFKSE